MPAGIGYGRQNALALTARAAQGIPQPLAAPVGTPTVPDLLALLRSGQVSAEALLAFLSMLAGLGPGGVPQAPEAEAPSEIEQAFLAQGGQGA